MSLSTGPYHCCHIAHRLYRVCVCVVCGARVGPIIPKYYYVSKDCVEAEKAYPGSQDRLPSNEDAEKGNIYLWGQSVYLISQLLSQLLCYYYDYCY